MNRIALAVIAGDDCVEQGIERMLRSVEGKVDHVSVSFNGENSVTPNTIYTICRDLGLTYSMGPMRWVDDFSAARNHSFRLVRDAGFTDSDDYVLWLDCDDMLPGDTDLQALIHVIEERRAHGAILPYHYLVGDDGQPLIVQYKERLLRADVDWTWVQPIHEQPIPPFGCRLTHVDDCHVVHTRGQEDDGTRRARNRRIVARWWREAKDTELRPNLYMANETYVEAELEEDPEKRRALADSAIALYRVFLDNSDYSDPGVVEENYSANLMVARCLTITGRHDQAIDICLQGIKLQPTWPAAYVTIAETYLSAGHYDEAIQWANTTRAACHTPASLHHVYDPGDLDYKPLMVEGHALLARGSHAEHDYYMAAMTYADALNYRDDEFTRKMRDKAYEMEAAQEKEWADAGSPVDIKIQRDRRWGARPERSISFWTAPHFEEWDARTIAEHGSGGTEVCITRLAQSLAERGWRAVIFGTPPTEGMDESGVEWYRAERWHPDEEFTASVAVRVPQIMDSHPSSPCRILWAHDVNMGDVRYDLAGRDRFAAENIDAVACPSRWHVDHLVRVYGLDSFEPDVDPDPSYFGVVPNGFDRDLFLPRGHERDPYKFVYASSPDRGLVRLLELWPEIRRRHPKAHLHVFYGWESIDRIVEAGLPTAPMLAAFKARVIRTIDDLGGEDGGVIWHGRVDQATLAHHLRGHEDIPATNLMLYPAAFCETFGLAFAQAMTAGCLPLSSALGNLPDLIGKELLLVNGSPDSEDFGRRYLDRLDALMKPDDRELIRKKYEEPLAARTLAYTWDTVTDHWESLIERVVDKKAQEVTM